MNNTYIYYKSYRLIFPFVFLFSWRNIKETHSENVDLWNSDVTHTLQTLKIIMKEEDENQTTGKWNNTSHNDCSHHDYLIYLVTFYGKFLRFWIFLKTYFSACILGTTTIYIHPKHISRNTMLELIWLN